MEPTDHNLRAWERAHRRPAAEGLPAVVRERLPDLQGRHVLQLGCGTGEAAAELADLGALVTGVDASAEAVRVAHERAPRAALLHADPQALPVELRRGRFDVVYAGAGTLASVTDLDAWAAGVAAALRAGGGMLLFDRHPVAECLDAALRWRTDYFADRDGFWRVGRIVTAVARAGLHVHRLEELTAEAPARRQDPRVPAFLVLLALKPAP